ncbi:NAD-dependent epimerase/dehydratase family protein [Dactylosporangium sp. NBC_01737]|uniref:NAD-dependent epimerase/dehydratase family protein n=1 Tax=Dactylosporangium sp. NBC_01737 TaxID=2975959 RepID=UPI003FA38516
MKVVVAGGSGGLGRRICRDLAGRGHEVVVLSRSPAAPGSGRWVRWDGATVGGWADELAGAAQGDQPVRRPGRPAADPGQHRPADPVPGGPDPRAGTGRR